MLRKRKGLGLSDPEAGAGRPANGARVLTAFYTSPRASGVDPLILTALFDTVSALRFDSLRRAYFPAKRNFVPAHCTLFHKLPGEREAEVVHLIGALAERARPFTVFTSGVLNFGRGVAYGLDAPALVALREEIGHAMSPWLSDQDRQRYRPHVTIQNKADPAAARQLLASLEDDFSPQPIRIEGLSLWRYRGGPWDPAATFRFGQPPAVHAPPGPRQDPTAR